MKTYETVINDLLNYHPSELNQISNQTAEDAIKYGFPCNRIKDGVLYPGSLFISPKTITTLCLSDIINDTINYIKCANIVRITFKKNFENMQGYIPTSTNEFYCQIEINKESIDLKFYNQNDLILFVKSLLISFEAVQNLNKENIDFQVDKYVYRYNINFDHIMDNDELLLFSRDMGVDVNKLIIEVNTNKNNIVEREEFRNYIKKKLSGSEFFPTFKKYCSICISNNEYYMTPNDLRKFFIEVQKEEITILEAYQLVIKFNSVINNGYKKTVIESIEKSYINNNYNINQKEIQIIILKINQKIKESMENSELMKLYLSLTEFSIMLHSILLTVYDTKKINSDLDESHPLIDYFCYSSHNTYLTGHQLKGKSSTKMYSSSVLEGCRCVELDCYNDNGNIKITHGYTFVSDLKLDDILYELRENGFVNSPYPIILSIENHLDKKHQDIMAEKFKSILKDLYIIHYLEKPHNITNLEELK